MKLYDRFLSPPTPEGWRYLALRRNGPPAELDQRAAFHVELKTLKRLGFLECERHVGPGLPGHGLDGYRPTGGWAWEEWPRMVEAAKKLHVLRAAGQL